MSINKDKLIELTSKLVAVDSYLRDTNDYPNATCKEVLAVFKEITEDLGFTTKINEEGFWGWAEIGPADTEMVGIIGHLDVVGPGNLDEWKTPVFEATVKDNMIYGRGVIDDKGPIALSLLVMKELLDEGNLTKRIRVIVGTDEEVLWRGIEEYKKTEELPSIGFSPDLTFPVVYAEKALLQVQIEGPAIEGMDVTFGEVFNKVPDMAKFDFGDKADEVEENAKAAGFEYSREGNVITFEGDSRHAKDAAGSKNAIVNLFKSLPASYDNPLVKFIKEEIGLGEAIAIFGEKEDKPSGKLTFNIGKAVLNSEKIILSIDMRIPVEASSKKEVMTTLGAKADEYGIKLIEYDFLPKVYSPLDSDLVNKMMASYKAITGKDDQPVSSGGATYARSMPNILAFGSKFIEEPGTEHKENEQLNLDKSIIAGDIYLNFLKSLM